MITDLIKENNLSLHERCDEPVFFSSKELQMLINHDNSVFLLMTPKCEQNGEIKVKLRKLTYHMSLFIQVKS